MRCYTAIALGRVLGIGEDSVRTLTRKGIIREGRLDNGLYDIEAAAREIIAHMEKPEERAENADYTSERARLMRIRRKNAEYDLGLREKELHTSEDIELATSRILVNFKSKIRAIPSRMAPQCAKLTSREEIYALLKQAMDEALEELADISTIFEEGESEDGEKDPNGDGEDKFT